MGYRQIDSPADNKWCYSFCVHNSQLDRHRKANTMACVARLLSKLKKTFHPMINSLWNRHE